jgi:hypothetical protein
MCPFVAEEGLLGKVTGNCTLTPAITQTILTGLVILSGIPYMPFQQYLWLNRDLVKERGRNNFPK